MHDYTAFTLQFLTQSKDDSIVLLVNHLCCKQSWVVPTPGVSRTIGTENDPQKLNIPRFSTKEKAKADRSVDLKRTHQKSHRAESYKKHTADLLLAGKKAQDTSANSDYHNSWDMTMTSQLHENGFQVPGAQGQWAGHTCLREVPLIWAQSLQTEPTALPLQHCKHGASSQLPGVSLGASESSTPSFITLWRCPSCTKSIEWLAG